MANRAPLSTGEWYHCYNRGVDKRTVFETTEDYDRFLAYLYACNGATTTPLSYRHKVVLRDVLHSSNTLDREPLVEIGAYALMGNHQHLIVKPLIDGGLSKFMQRVFTGYTMYFNLTRKRTGPLFSGVFKSKHIGTDDYLKRAIAYVLMNPVEIFEPEWKEGQGNLSDIESFLLSYRYSSLPKFLNQNQTHESHKICVRLEDYYDSKPRLKDILRDAKEYYESLPSENLLRTS